MFEPYEFRDPIYGFITLNEREKAVVDSEPFQRLRHIHQLGLSSLVYPSATHKRFEHSLGVMHLAGRVFDVAARNIHPDIRKNETFIEMADPSNRDYWRGTLRLAALCHDLGHLPFSHVAEIELLPDGWDHERLTVAYIKNGPGMAKLWRRRPPVYAREIAKLAVGKKKLPKAEFSVWEEVMSEIIVGDAFGVDRMDYLLRDSYHCGVAYGHFDHHRLIDTFRILPEFEESSQPALGVEEGGLHVAEALLLARYFMFTQVYYHPTRRIMDLHLQQFLSKYLEDSEFSTNLSDHLSTTDNEIYSALLKAAKDSTKPGHEQAARIVNRKHFRLVTKKDINDPDAGEAIAQEAREKFGKSKIIRDFIPPKSQNINFPVWCNRGKRTERVESSVNISAILSKVPPLIIDRIYCAPEIFEDVDDWYQKNRKAILSTVRRRETSVENR